METCCNLGGTFFLVILQLNSAETTSHLCAQSMKPVSFKRKMIIVAHPSTLYIRDPDGACCIVVGWWEFGLSGGAGEGR